MGSTYVKAKLINPFNPEKFVEEKFLVDSGSEYSVAPAQKLHDIGIKPIHKQIFLMVDGTPVIREVGEVVFEFEGRRKTSPVVFGKRQDAALFGLVTLETMALVLNPFTRRLKPMKLRI